MRLLNTLYVTEHGARVGVRSGAVLVTTRDGQKTRVPFNALDGIVFTGRAQPSGDLLAECARRRLRLAALTRGGRLRYSVGGPVGGNVHLRVAQHQASADDTRRVVLARAFVTGKLQNARRMLMRWAWGADSSRRRLLDDLRLAVEDRLMAVQHCEDGDRIRGMEGDGTRRYFRGLALHLGERQTGIWFAGRNRRPPRDPANALMSYVYGLSLAELAGALDAVGLDPQVGYLHGVRSGRQSLALDLLEEFRPAFADRFVVRTISRRRVDIKDFIRTPGGACFLSEEGRRKVLDAYEAFKSEPVRHLLLDRVVPRSRLASIQATLLARHLLDDLDAYPPFVSEV